MIVNRLRNNLQDVHFEHASDLNLYLTLTNMFQSMIRNAIRCRVVAEFGTRCTFYCAKLLWQHHHVI